MRRGLLALVVGSLAFCAVGADAWARGPDAARLARWLARPGRAHPLADASGRIPLTLQHGAGTAPPPGWLDVAPGVAARLFAPEALDAFAAANPGVALEFAPPLRPQLDVSTVWTHAKQFRADTGYDGAGVVLGFIDTGLDVAHPDFRTAAGKTRIAWMLTADVPRGVHGALESHYGCDDPAQASCAIWDAHDIDVALSTAALDEPRDPDGHGTHVASIAAGNGGPMAGAANYVGVAPHATIIAAAPGFYDGEILNAARFVFERAESMGLPAVLNVSLGSDYGPHDGTSPLERGLAALVGDDHPGRAIVVAAGNSGAMWTIDGRGPFGVHSEVHVAPSGPTRVPLQVVGTTGSVSGSGFVWITFRPGDEVRVGLEGPGGATWIGGVGPGEDAGYSSDDQTASIVNALVDDRSPLTADTNGAVVTFSGSWDAAQGFAIVLEGRGDAQLWATGTGGAAAGQSLGLLFERGMFSGTVAVPASAPELIAVGCTLNRTHWKPLGSTALELASFGSDDAPEADSVCYFSGHGPNASGVPKPELVAPGAYVGAAMAHDADPRLNPNSIFAGVGCPDGTQCHLLDERHALTSGTSMAAPHVAGAVALLLQRDPTLAQARIAELLQAGAAHPLGKVPRDYQLGAGRLDLEGTLRVLEADAASAGGADPASSFYVLSMPYARPDTSYPVRAIVQLRRSNLAVATGVGVESLELDVKGGEVVEPLAASAGGLFTFAVAASEGSAGGVLWLDVRLNGQSLGERALPIGFDSWTASGGVLAAGGCSVARGDRHRDVWLWALAALAGACVRVARRRR